MDRPQIKFGDKIFLQGWFLTFLDYFDQKEYNAVRGFVSVGGIEARPIRTDIPDASIPGFVVDMGYADSLAPETAFSQADVVDVTDKLCLYQPLPAGTKIWMLVTHPL